MLVVSFAASYFSVITGEKYYREVEKDRVFKKRANVMY